MDFRICVAAISLFLAGCPAVPPAEPGPTTKPTVVEPGPTPKPTVVEPGPTTKPTAAVEATAKLDATDFADSESLATAPARERVLKALQQTRSVATLTECTTALATWRDLSAAAPFLSAIAARSPVETDDAEAFRGVQSGVRVWLTVHALATDEIGPYRSAYPFLGPAALRFERFDLPPFASPEEFPGLRQESATRAFLWECAEEADDPVERGAALITLFRVGGAGDRMGRVALSNARDVAIPLDQRFMFADFLCFTRTASVSARLETLDALLAESALTTEQRERLQELRKPLDMLKKKKPAPVTDLKEGPK